MPSEGLSDGILRYFAKVGMTVRVFLTGWIFKVVGGFGFGGDGGNG
ncbi:TPA: hypothetical protein ACTC1I_001255 [Neisseria meningitidis]